MLEEKRRKIFLKKDWVVARSVCLQGWYCSPKATAHEPREGSVSMLTGLNVLIQVVFLLHLQVYICHSQMWWRRRIERRKMKKKIQEKYNKSLSAVRLKKNESKSSHLQFYTGCRNFIKIKQISH